MISRPHPIPLIRFWFLAALACLLSAPWACTSSSNPNPAAPVTVVVTATPVPFAGSVWNLALAYTASPAGTQFSRRNGHSTVAYNGAMWLIGGNNLGYLLNDAWNSTDGTSWTKVLADNLTPPSSQFSEREAFTTLAYKGALWVIGGDGNSGHGLNDVWTSSNGVSWTQVLADNASPGSNQFPERYEHTAVVYNGAMWVIGGNTGSAYLNDVWTSSDGVSWTQVLADAPTPAPGQFSERYGHSSVVYNGAMWVIGGTTGSAYLNDVWNSSDGAHWTQVLADNSTPPSSQFPQRFGHSSVVYNGAMWVMAGLGQGVAYLNDIWNSTDGAHWNQVAAGAAFSKRYLHGSVVYNPATGSALDGRIWVNGGYNGSTLLNDVWYSP